ncbi:glycosyl hydrolase [Archangium primigenium]|uniref:glycosyl hydrolase n=1 Tax=[Archangium] primigenium TaxID=2792470 RepID=UPI00195BEB29|nr:glycosyl hydrolase [Archangium primigenium]MBM7117162.1 discoidin domain-containing protein [Archangium primigenium]
MTLFSPSRFAVSLVVSLCLAGVSTPAEAKSAKRGLGYGYHSADDMRALSGGMSWWYNWSPKPETTAASVAPTVGVSFVPMVWGGTPKADELAASIPTGAQYLLGFNEPNFLYQANKTPSQAAALWPVLEDVARRKNLKLVSPAVNYCGDCVSEGGVKFTDPVVYLDAFFAACKTCQVDYIAVHWYACDLSALKWYVGLFKKYNRPIWLTEFACGDRPHDQITLDVQKKYMTEAVDYLENEPAVFRYAWFSGRNNEIPHINLLGASGQLTELGRLYVSLPEAGSGGGTQPPTAGKLTPVSATASSSENAGTGPDKAIDGNLGTRWSSAFADPQSLVLDFGATKKITGVKLQWEAAYGKDYQLQVSGNGSTWTTVTTVTNGDGGVDEFTHLSATGRYLRLYGTKRSSGYGYSLFEVDVFGGTP